MATTKKTATKTAKAAPKKVATQCCAKKTCACKTCSKKKEEKDDKHKFIIFGLALTLAILASSFGIITFARYATTISGKASTSVAAWKVAITDGSDDLSDNFTLTLTPSNEHTEVAEGKIAPGSTATGTFVVDYTGTEVSTETIVEFDIPATLAAQNAEIALKKDGNAVTCTVNGTKQTCTSNMSLSEVATTKSVTYTVEINWDDHSGYDASEDNETDTTNGITAGTTNLDVTISAKQSFTTGS